MVLVFAIPAIITEYTTSYTEMCYLVNRLEMCYLVNRLGIMFSVLYRPKLLMKTT